MRYNRAVLLDRMADHVLAHGLGQATLRRLAAASGTSDRMLLYHFQSKSMLVAALLDHLALRMKALLDAAVTPATFETEAALVTVTVGAMRSPLFSPYIRVWLEIVAAAAGGESAHRETGERIARLYLQWLAMRHPDGERGALNALRLIEGTILLDAIGFADQPAA
ncbi:TetR/AcrR family transcriptional regulator [Sphingomonas sp. FW199]|uniref:TetR/AcrR family transcriptional regulator n=1 Tax=Sphingomonas sp. FW199 TaxID=3400217 RepID=UPI003CF79772